MHVSPLARMLNVLRLLVLDLCEHLQILCSFIHSALLCNRTLLRRVNTDYSDKLQIGETSGSQTLSSRYPNQGSDYVILHLIFRSDRS